MPGPIDGLRNALLTSKIIMCLEELKGVLHERISNRNKTRIFV